MDEWIRENQYNSFNSWKGLLYGDWYKAIMDRKFLPPVEASLDPIHRCNLGCRHCNSARYISYDKDAPRMTDAHLLDLVEFLGDWGVRATCFGGGGEPTLHTSLHRAVILAASKGMKTSLATNGTNITPEILETVPIMRWVGVSVDAAKYRTYKKLKKVNAFNKVISNIKNMVKKVGDSKCDISFKFLISEVNQYEIADACKIASELGVRDFHARPADYSHQGMGRLSGKIGNIDIGNIVEQFHECRLLERPDFRVFTVVHKFDRNFLPRKNFTQCYAAPLTIQLCADGNVYFCVDQRHQKEFLLGTHYPDPENIKTFWGGKRHQELVFGDTPKNCTTRCTYGVYCEQCEQLFAKDNQDPMCWEFP